MSIIKNNDIMVSVCCLVYNHEKYLRQCLDGFMMQKTNFKFEVLIHDDASTDGSADIIREYEKKYPDIIKPIYQTENQYSKGIKISWTYQYPRAKGKYIALCEGDDYWIDEYKLQKQFDALEEHDEAVFCSHKVCLVSESGDRLTDAHFSESTSGVYSSAQWIKMICTASMYFQTSSYFFKRSLVSKHINNLPDFLVVSAVGDIPLMLLAISEGGLCYIDKEMSCRRLMSIGSWTMRAGKNIEIAIDSNQRSIKSFLLFDEFTNHQYSDDIHFAVLKYETQILEYKENYLPLLSYRYRPIWRQYSVKNKLYRIMWILCPPIMRYYVKKRENRD